MKRIVWLGVLLAGCATRHRALVAVPVGITCVTATVALAVAAGGVSGDPVGVCAALAEQVAHGPRMAANEPAQVTCIPIGSDRWDCR
jgi:hypothetical protein